MLFLTLRVIYCIEFYFLILHFYELDIMHSNLFHDALVIRIIREQCLL